MNATLDENGRAELSLIDDSPDWDDYNRYLDLQAFWATGRKVDEVPEESQVLVAPW